MVEFFNDAPREQPIGLCHLARDAPLPYDNFYFKVSMSSNMQNCCLVFKSSNPELTRCCFSEYIFLITKSSFRDYKLCFLIFKRDYRQSSFDLK